MCVATKANPAPMKEARYWLGVHCQWVFEPTTAQKIRPWNKNHMAFPELACVGRPRGKVAFHAHCTAIQRSRILAPASEEARDLAKHMSNEKAKETMLMVAADCDRFAVRTAERSIDKLVVRRLIKGS
jgi:hypothetical protein